MSTQEQRPEAEQPDVRDSTLTPGGGEGPSILKEESRWKQLLGVVLLPFLAIVTALVISSIFIIIADAKVLAAWREFFQAPSVALSLSLAKLKLAYGALLQGGLGDPAAIWKGLRVWQTTGDRAPFIKSLEAIDRTLVYSTPYIFAGLAVALGFRSGLFNIGVEGQLFIGAMAATYIGYSIKGLPMLIHLPLALLAGALAGAIWSAIAGFLKAYTGAHEVVTTIMLNYVAFRLSDYMLTGPMKRSGFNPVSPPIEKSAWLPKLAPDPLRFHAGFFLALIAAYLVYWFLWKTTWGFEMRTVGSNPSAARYAGISVANNFILAMALSGALGGLAGTNEILGVNHFMAEAFSSGYGFDSIALALLGKSHPVGVVLASLLWGFLKAGATRMQSAAGVPIDIVQIVQGMVIVFVAAPELVRMIWRIKLLAEEGETIFTRGWGA